MKAKVVFPLIFMATLSLSPYAKALEVELRSSNTLKAKIALEQESSVEMASKKFFKQEKISYYLSQEGKSTFFSFVDGKNWPWCVWVERLAVYLPHLPAHAYPKIYRPIATTLETKLNNETDRLIWDHCDNLPMNM